MIYDSDNSDDSDYSYDSNDFIYLPEYNLLKNIHSGIIYRNSGTIENPKADIESAVGINNNDNNEIKFFLKYAKEFVKPQNIYKFQPEYNIYINSFNSCVYKNKGTPENPEVDEESIVGHFREKNEVFLTRLGGITIMNTPIKSYYKFFEEFAEEFRHIQEHYDANHEDTREVSQAKKARRE